MSAQYFAGNSLAAFLRTSVACVDVTTAGTFDSAYVPGSISVTTSSDYISRVAPFMDGSSSLSGNIWLRFDLYSTGGGVGDICLMKRLGVNAYRITFTGFATYQVQYWNTSTGWTNWGSTFTIPNSSLRTMVLKLSVNVGYTLYVGGSSIASSAVVPTNGVTAVDEFRFSGDVTAYYSQIMCGDYDNRDAHLMVAALTGNSASNTGGTGAYTDINELVLDDTTVEAITAVGNKMGQTHAAITVPPGYGITGAVLNARGRANGGVVTDGKLGFRSGGTNYSGSGRGYNGGFEPRGYFAAANPNTGGVWTQTTFNANEPYFEAA